MFHHGRHDPRARALGKDDGLDALHACLELVVHHDVVVLGDGGNFLPRGREAPPDGLFRILAAASQVNSNMVRAIAISSKQRSPLMPNLPAVSESGIASLAAFDVTGWNGIVVKAGTPSDRIKLLSEHIKRALDAPDVIERIAKLGAEVAPSTPEEFGVFMRAEDKKWADLVRKADLKIE